MKKPLISFLGKQEIKDAKIADIKRHRQLDNMVPGLGSYYNIGSKKGCAVTCTMYTPEELAECGIDTKDIHGLYETRLGIPRQVAALEDRIFESLPVAEAKEWPLKFIEAVPVGVNLDNVWRKLMIWLLVDETEGVIKYAKSADGRKAIQDVADALTRSLETPVSSDEFLRLRVAARRSYAYAADAAAADAAAADAAYADAAAAAAAYAAAADAADADAAARRNARIRRWIMTSEKLIQLLKEAK